MTDKRNSLLQAPAHILKDLETFWQAGLLVLSLLFNCLLKEENIFILKFSDEKGLLYDNRKTYSMSYHLKVLHFVKLPICSILWGFLYTNTVVHNRTKDINVLSFKSLSTDFRAHFAPFKRCLRQQKFCRWHCKEK